MNPTSERFLAPRALFVGFLTAFLGCCLAGYCVSRTNIYPSFVRFHRYINRETSYFPTVHQVTSLVTDTTPEDKILVIVGGNSIVFGIGQSESEVWTNHLQRHLGDEYRVINLAFPAASPFEVGGITREILRGRYKRMLFVTIGSVAGTYERIDGHGYRYFFWSARKHGLLIDSPDRIAFLREAWKTPGSLFQPKAQWEELHRHVVMDRYCYFSDLWTSVSYRHGSTIWSPLLGHRFMHARQSFSDPDPGSAKMNPTTPEQDDRELAFIRSQSKRTDEADAASYNKLICPEELRSQTLFVLLYESPYYLTRLTPKEYRDYSGFLSRTKAALLGAGFNAVEFGRDYPQDHFIDRCHLTEPGGRQLAQEVASVVRDQARRLGYVQEDAP